MIILASSSPTRAKILEDFGVAFTQEAVDFDENTIQTQNPKEFAYQATLGKFRVALEKLGTQIPLLCADSVVSVEGKLQRKARDVFDAKAMLEVQSGKNIEIITCMIYKSIELELIDISSARYSLAPFETQTLQEYLESKQWMGKAGCVMVEGFHKKYTLEKKGLESTALGLSVEKILPFLETQ